jgi:hypothetical protein
MNNSHHGKAVLILLIITAFLLSLGVFGGTAYAYHSWGDYHWARTANPFSLKLGDNVSPVWDAYLSTAGTDWSISSVLNTSIVLGQSNPKNCRATSGRVEVCSSKYGNNGWLGLAQIWASGMHITKGIVKVNDSYFNTYTYNTPAWRNLVMCQEIGHILGLDHQDENFDNSNLNTCMDYTSDPSTNQHPNQHDYDELVTIYTHLDALNTVSASTNEGRPALVGQDIDLDNPSAWGQAIKQDARGNNSLYMRNLGNGEKVFTFVTWTQ